MARFVTSGMKKNLLNLIIIPLRLLIFERSLFSTLTFFQPGSLLNCEADETGVSCSIASIDSHLLTSKQSFFTYFVDILQVLPEI